jgi:hypothetical protein
MKTLFIIIVTSLIAFVVIAAVFIMAVSLQEQLCKECSNERVCRSHHDDGDYLPPCLRHSTLNRHELI